MIRLGYHASHEEFSPRDLLRFAKRAEAAGFDCAMSSDHFHPWGAHQGHSGYAWSWLGAALEGTSLPMGIISVPGWRYHVAVLAQKAATLAQMYPGRFWLALGSGENLNEHITGEAWPSKVERNARLRECVDVIRALWAGETVNHRGRVTVDDARLYSRPDEPPPLFGACVTERTAQWLGGWADGLLTVQGTGPDAIRPVIDAFRRGGGEGRPVFVQVALSWAPTEAEALRQAHEQWRTNALGGDVNWDLRMPEDFEQAARFVRPEDMPKSVLVGADVGRIVGWLEGYAALGVEELQIHLLGRDQERLIDAFGEAVLPRLRA